MTPETVMDMLLLELAARRQHGLTDDSSSQVIDTYRRMYVAALAREGRESSLPDEPEAFLRLVSGEIESRLHERNRRKRAGAR
ncbi:MAG: hypothetical protein PW735_11615 [Acidobacteriaceae bacterium]|nr:hypothetical protein [Acidobacteriaceae bacterium]